MYWIKWKHMLICLVHAWYWRSFVSSITDLLSENRVLALRAMLKSWERREWSHKASFEAWVMVTYLASVVDNAIISCNLVKWYCHESKKCIQRWCVCPQLCSHPHQHTLSDPVGTIDDDKSEEMFAHVNGNYFDTNKVLKYYIANHMYHTSTCSSPYQPYLNKSIFVIPYESHSSIVPFR